MLNTVTHIQHPYNQAEEDALGRFRERFVDLGSKATHQGRALRDQIISEVEGISGQDGFPLVLVGQSFGAGSFGRRTLCRPLDDIDIYIVLNAGGALLWENNRYYALEGSTPNSLNTDASLQVGRWISSDLVLRRVASRLGSLPIVQRAAIDFGVNDKGKSAFIKFQGLNVDLTPVLWATNFIGAIDRYYMPHRRGAYWWKPTNPKEDQRKLSNQNQSQSGLTLPTIRLLKWWNENQNARRLKGIHLEVMAERAMAQHYLGGIAQALHLSFFSISLQLREACADPTALGPPLDVNLSAEDRVASIQAASAAYLQAVNAATHFSQGAVRAGIADWQRDFPGI